MKLYTLLYHENSDCCYKAEVWESRDNMACYERDDVED